MKTCYEYLQLVKARYGLTSDYQVGKFLGIPPSYLSKYKNGKNTFNEQMVFEVAELLDLPPEQIYFDVATERTKDPKIRAIFAKAAKALTPAAIAFWLIFATASPTIENAALYILCKIERFLIRFRKLKKRCLYLLFFLKGLDLQKFHISICSHNKIVSQGHGKFSYTGLGIF